MNIGQEGKTIAYSRRENLIHFKNHGFEGDGGRWTEGGLGFNPFFKIWEKELNTIVIEEKESYTMTPYLKNQIPYFYPAITVSLLS